SISSVGGTYTLTGDLNLGNAFGVFAKYFTSGTAVPATAGSLRLSNLDTIGWRNFANSGNLLLAVNSSDQLTFNGSPIQPLLSLSDGEMWIGDSTNTPIGRTLSGDVTVTDLGVTSIGALKITNAMLSNTASIAYGKLNLTGSIVNADIYSAAAIAYSKLSLSASIVNADIAPAAAIAYSKLVLTGAVLNADLAGSIAYSKLILTGDIVNADIATAAAIAYSKLAALTASRVLVSDGSGIVSASSITNTTLGYLDATSSIQTQINGKQATLTLGNLTDAGTDGITVTGGTGAVVGSGTSLSQHVANVSNNGYLSSTDWSTFNGKQPAGSYLTALPSLADTKIWVGNGSAVATAVNVSGDATLADTGALTLANTAVGAGSYTLASITVDSKGRITSASNGAAGAGTVNSGTQYQLAYYAATGTAVSGLTLITANKVLLSDANGLPVASSITNTTLGYLDATSSIQTQLNAKAAASSVPAFTKWTAYTPTVPTNITLGNGSITGRYTVIGNVLKYQVTVGYGSTTSVGGNVDVSASIPAGFTISTALLGGLSYNCIGYATFHHDLTGVAYIGMIRNDSGTTCYVVFNVNGNVMNATIPVAY